ncbi:hypothetical protein H9Q13_06570 [Pontibacter sp. JH31]|uniref:Uncharacterized protein n=1 Tax=Pontibacter aquaedesilientis TaxID=2766980 RepID=A0ABR7XEW1_9BACT|nr:hypothetical protein [Pontibacter aquaedesilientis]MBD1396824.1 hypothetical protein [Pontibacter aquaedesilientis]
MNRYLFWALMSLPWLAFFFSMYVWKDVSSPIVFIVNIAVLQALVINSRRKQVGMRLTETLKAVIPGIGYHEWRRLYFAKP